MITFDVSHFEKTMTGFVEYAEAFLREIGTAAGVAEDVADVAVEAGTEFIDSMARTYPERLHHVYEWGQPGIASARLFKINKSSMTNSVQLTLQLFKSTRPTESGHIFEDKARIMEAGIPVTISPKNSSMLVFDIGDKTIFTKNTVTVQHPGGVSVGGSLESTFRAFLDNFDKTFMHLTFATKARRIAGFFNPRMQTLTASAGKAAGQRYLRSLTQ
jgi:hypothetical protein